MKNLFQQLGFLLAVIAVSFLTVYVFMDISRVYKLPCVEDLSWLQLYGVTIIITLIRGTKKPDYTITFEKQVSTFSYRLFIVLFGWGFARLLYFILS